MILTFSCNGLTRRLQKVENAVVAVRQDNSVDTIRIAMRQEEFNNIDLSEVSVKMLYVDEEGTTKAYQTGTAPIDGVYYADWELTSDVVDAEGNVTFAVKLAIVDNGDVVKEWFSIPETFRVYDSLDDSNNPPGETESEQATNAEKIAQLTSELGTTNANLETLGDDIDSVRDDLEAVAASYENLGAVTAIPNNADLNDYTTPGSYAATSNATAATLSNLPEGVNKAFRLDVINALGGPDGTWRQQRILMSATAGMIYYRYFSGSNWGQWQMLPTRAEMDNTPKANGNLAVSAVADVTALLSLDGGMYRVASASWVSNNLLPEGYGLLEVIKSGGTYAYLRLTTAAGNVYKRAYDATSHTWTETEWEKVPTRSEMDTLTSNLGGVTFSEKFSVTSSGKTLTVPNNYRGVIYITDATVTNCGAYFIVASSNGSVRYRAITDSAGLTISTAANALTLTAGESASLSCIAMNISSKIQMAN